MKSLNGISGSPLEIILTSYVQNNLVKGVDHIRFISKSTKADLSKAYAWGLQWMLIPRDEKFSRWDAQRYLQSFYQG